jgi:hypothetical protein
MIPTPDIRGHPPAYNTEQEFVPRPRGALLMASGARPAGPSCQSPAFHAGPPRRYRLPAARMGHAHRKNAPPVSQRCVSCRMSTSRGEESVAAPLLLPDLAGHEHLRPRGSLTRSARSRDPLCPERPGIRPGPGRPGGHRRAGHRIARRRFAEAIATGDGQRYWPVITEHVGPK